MKESIKKINQLAKILENYAKYRIREFISNNNLLHTRHVSISIYNKYKASDYTRMHRITPKIKLVGFLEFLKSFKESEMRERRMHNCFYIGSLNHRATYNFPGQLEPGFHYIQKFYKSHTKITLLNIEKDFLTHTKI